MPEKQVASRWLTSARKSTSAGVAVRGRFVRTDDQGYLRDPSDWSEDFARAVAEREGLRLTSRHWAVIRYLRDYVNEHSIPVSCADLDTILHFRACWPRACGQPRWLPGLFPAGGLRKQGHRLAGLPRGDHGKGCRLDV